MRAAFCVLRAACCVVGGSLALVVFSAAAPRLSLGPGSHLVLAWGPSVVSAQSDPRLVAAVRLAQDGQGDSARAAVRRVLNATPAADPVYAEAIFTSGVVAATAAERERFFQRLVVEYNGSPWADDALLQLAQLNFARGDLPGVIRNVERLASDYPQSEVIPQTATWAARAYFRQEDTADGCRWVSAGLAHVDTLNVELKNALSFLNGRCVAAGDTAVGRPGGQAVGDTTKPVAPDTSAHPPVRPSVWSVQVASSNSQANADALVARLARDGFRGGFVVSDGATFKVRVGQFATRANADDLAGHMRSKYPSVFVVESRP